MAGRLVIVGTPLGNREDLSPRARRAVLEAGLLLCEDTRSPARLLGVEVELPRRKSCFVGNEHERVPELLSALAAGQVVVYMSEAGMPGWSDPGQRLVRAAAAAGYEVDVVPGPTALTTAVCHSGLPCDEVRFCGFPPRSGPDRSRWLASLVHETATVVCYEAGNRTHGLLRDLVKALPDAACRQLVVARELTKVHQEVIRGTVAELQETLADPVLGEVTVVLGPGTPRTDDPARAAAQAVLDVMLDGGLRPRERARRLADLTGRPARDIYQQLVAGRGEDESEA